MVLVCVSNGRARHRVEGRDVSDERDERRERERSDDSGGDLEDDAGGQREDDAGEDDDWFELALREDGTGDGRGRASDDSDGGISAEPAADFDADTGVAPETRTGSSASGSGSNPNSGTDSDTNLDSDADTDSDSHSSSNSSDGVDTDSDSGSDSDLDSDSDSDTDSTADSRSLFDEDFGAALENVEVPTVDDEEDSAGFSDLEFGFTDPGESNFDEEVESALPRIDIGIEGLDRMIQGGVPERSLLVTIGSAGTGKTTFGLQFLNHALENGENAVFITLEETRERVINSAVEKGYPFDEYCEAGQLAVVDMDPVEMANSLASIQSELPRLIEDFDASRLVLDSVSLLEMMYDERARRRNEIFGFTQSLKDAGVTAMLTSEAAEQTTYASRFGIVEYLTDAVFVLQYVRSDAISETRLAIEIQKIRDANHSRETKPYEITDEGISVYQQANLF